MPRRKTSIKKTRADAKKHFRNLKIKTQLKKTVKKFLALVSAKNAAEAKEALKISYISYDNGVGINLDVIDSQVALGQVEKNLASGMYDYLLAQAYLDRTMGREYFSNISEIISVAGWGMIFSKLFCMDKFLY